MNISNLVTEIVNFQRDAIVEWKKEGINQKQQNLLSIVEKNHAFNYQLWHAEDRARRDDLGFEFVYRAKREIDLFNQQRNNCMEKIDEWFINHLKPAASSVCPVHSETPGMMIDRLSILTLKIYHMHLQTVRDDVEEIHRQTCLTKLKTLNTQRYHLQKCLQELLSEVINQTRTFQVYHQFKMYNDVNLNPELYIKS